MIELAYIGVGVALALIAVAVYNLVRPRRRSDKSGNK